MKIDATCCRILLAVLLSLVPPHVFAAPGDTELISTSAIGTPTGGIFTEVQQDMDRVISADGRYVVFHRGGRYLRRDRVTDETVIVAAAPSLGPSIASPSMSPDGRYVAFPSAAADLVGGDTNERVDAFVRDMATGVIDLASVGSGGEPANGDSWSVSVSADGRFVAFSSSASNLVAADDNGMPDVFVRDLLLKSTERLAGYSTNSRQSFRPMISGDGRYVVFDEPYSNGRSFITFYDRSVGHLVYELDDCDEAWISASGGTLAYRSSSALRIGQPSLDHSDIFTFTQPVLSGALASASSSGARGDAASWSPSVSDDGRFVAFVSSAANLVANDTNEVPDVFVRDMLRQITWRVSVGSDGRQANGASGNAAISGDGRYVVFSTVASNLAPNDTNGVSDVFVHQNPNVTGPQSFSLTPERLDFGNQTVGTYSAPLRVWLQNTGATALSVADISIGGSNPRQFGIYSGDCSAWIAAGAGCTIELDFAPMSTGVKTAEFIVVAGENVTGRTTLTGAGVASSFTLTPRSIEFGSVPVGTASVARTVVITNTGLGELPIARISRWGTDKSQFVSQNDCPSYVPVGGTCSATVRFKPMSTGQKSAYLKVSAQGGAGAKSVALHGSGT